LFLIVNVHHSAEGVPVMADGKKAGELAEGKEVPHDAILSEEPEYTEQDKSTDGVEDEAANEPQGLIGYSISSYGADYTVDSLVKRLQKGAFFVPPFQRSYVWGQRQASRFVESLLLGLPVPGIFVFKEDGSAKHVIVDGQQRLKSLQFFYEGTFRERKFRLVDVHPRWKGKTYKELDADDRQRLEDAIVHTTVFKQDNPGDKSSVYHVFQRLNTGASRLYPQELRNCVYYGKITELLEELNGNADWRAIFGKQNPRLKDRELILRFLALLFWRDLYRRPMNEFLSNFMNDHRNLGAERAEQFRTIFARTIALARGALGEKAFRPERFLNAAVFDAVMVGLATRVQQGEIKDSEKVRAAYDELLASKAFRAAYLRSTADEESVKQRTKLAIEAFGDC
jgi:hypothetical protein